MCGRYSLFLDRDSIEQRFDATFEDGYDPHYNAAPGQLLPVITNHAPETITHQEWGLVPEWADDDFDGLINARAETVTEKPSFRDAYERRRCLVPADGYYEWITRESGKQPYRITLASGEPFAMAGLWERWKPDTTQAGLSDFTSGSAGGYDQYVETFTILTTEPNEFQSQYHHRMPVVLDPEEEREWLANPSAALLDPYDGEMDAYPVSTRVNDPANDDPAVVDPIER